jgi:hypothetical protein
MSRIRIGTTATTAVVGWIVVACLGLWLVSQPFGLRWDFANFYDTGRRVLTGHGSEIYDATGTIADRAPLGVMRFWGVPLAGAMYVPMATMPARLAMAALKLQNALAIILGLVVLVRAFGGGRSRDRPVSQPPGGTALVLLALVFQPFWTVFLVGGQTTPVVFLCVAVTAALFASGRVWASGWVVSVALMLKPAFVFLLIPFLVDRRVRFLAAVGCSLAVLGALSVLAVGWPVHRVFLDRMMIGLGDDRLWQYNSALSVLFLNFSVPWPGAIDRLRMLGALVRLAIAAWLVALVWRSGRSWADGPGRRLYVVFMGVLFFLLTSEILWEHYLMVLLVPALFVLLQRELFSGRAVGLMGASVVACVGQNIGLTLLVDRFVVVETPLEALATGLWKTAPLLCMTVFLLTSHLELVTVLRAWAGSLSDRDAGRVPGRA